MQKNGFTLAEVLITLGIIGVVAALTAPALVKNAGTAKIGPSLSKFVNTFENAVEHYMADEGVSTFSGSVDEMAMLSEYMIMTPKTDGYTYTDATGANKYKPITDKTSEIKQILDRIMSGDNSVTVTDIVRLVNINGTTTIFQLKDGSVMMITPFVNGVKGSGSYGQATAEIIYDIDGDRTSNKAGKDVFGFIMDNKGVLVPAGSKTYKYLGYHGPWHLRGTAGNCNVTTSSIDDNMACTGRIADNNWKADY